MIIPQNVTPPNQKQSIPAKRGKGCWIVVLISAIVLVLMIMCDRTQMSDKLIDEPVYDTSISPRADLIRRITENKYYDQTEIDTIFKEMGTINTDVDGFDVRKVNLWSSADETRILNASLRNGTKVCIMAKHGEYLLVGTPQAPVFEWGYCISDFVKR